MQIEELIDSIAGEYNRELDHVFKEQIKTNILIARAEVIRQYIDKHRAFPSSLIMQINCLSTILVDIAECCTVDLDCDVLKSSVKIPSYIGLRNISDSFSYVGAINGKQPFGYIKPEELDFILADRFMKNKVFYSYINEYIYVFNRTNIKNIRIRGIFNDPYEIAKLNDCDGNDGCAELFNIPTDFISKIKSLVYAEMGNRNINTREEEVNLQEASNVQP